MAVPDQVPFNQYSASGSSDTFSYTFKILGADQLVVKLAGVVQSSGFTVTGVGNDAGGTVVFSANPSASTLVELSRSTPATRSTDYAPNGDLAEEVLDADFDRAYMALQEMQEQVDRTMKLPQGTTGSLDLDELVPDSFLRVNSAGDAIIQAAVLTPSGSFTVTPFAETLLDDANAAAMRTTLDVMSVTASLANGIGRLVDVQVYTSGTPSWINPYYLGQTSASGLVEIIIIAAGGSGGGADASTAGNTAIGGGAGAGAFLHAICYASALNVIETVTVGAAGAAVTAADGNNGGNSRFSASVSQYLLCTGGVGGGRLANGSTAAPALNGTGGVPTATGTWTILRSSNGNVGHYGQRFTGSIYIGAAGATSELGVGGIPPAGGAGSAARGYGAGGSGSVCTNGASGNASGSGTPGLVIVRTYY